MDLLVFDLDGTLLDQSSKISDFTRDTLRLLQQHNIAYTVATGRNLLSARDIIHDHGFVLPHVYTNGVLIWDPGQQAMSLANFLTIGEANHVLLAAAEADLTPFVHVITADGGHAIYHPPVRHRIEQQLLDVYLSRQRAPILPLDDIKADVRITNISMIGRTESVAAVEHSIEHEAGLVAYAGPAMEDRTLRWMDIHHSQASKGNAVQSLREQLGVQRVYCFGDSDNDLSMFAIADECYAPANAKIDVKAAATAVIGHHQDDGIARFLRERFNL